MKKTVSFLLVLAIAASLVPHSLAFGDIAEPVPKIAAEGLSTLGIVDAVNNFYPNLNLTRAQFCKMAVLAAGFNEASMYSSYTLYPDVRSGAWYVPYVNAAVRKYHIIKAYPSGLFGPDDSITYAQAITILLRMLGYEDSEVGAFWPRDFIIKADEIGLTRGMKSFGQNDLIPRSEAAVLINNMLLMNTKDGSVFVNTGFSAMENCVLLSTGETDPSLNSNEAVIWDGSEKSVYTGVALPCDLVGMYGAAVFDKNDPSRLIGFIANTKGASAVTVKSADESGVTTESGKLYISKSVKLANMGYISDYITGWFDIRPQSRLMVFKDSSGKIIFVSVMGTSASGDSIVYGTESFTPKPNARFVHDGTYLDQSKLKKYDVLSYVQSENTYYVCDDTLVLKYTDSGPTYKNPSYIEAGGLKFNIGEKASKYFENIKLNQVVTLLLDRNGNIAAAFTGIGQSSMAPKGILTKLSDGGEFEVKLESGYVLSGTADLSGMGTMNVENQPVTALYKSLGRFVKVYQRADGRFNITPVEMSKSGLPFGSEADLKGERFASAVKVYEQVGSAFPLHEVSGVTSLPNASIVHTETDRNGKINLIIANDITGDHYIYGMIKQTVETLETGYDLGGNPIYRDIYTLTVTNKDGTKSYSSFTNPGFSFLETPGAIAKDAFEGGKFTSVPAEKLNKLGTVKRDDFDSIRGVRVGSTYYDIHENAVVYAPDLARYISLSEARANFTSFTLYGTGRVCMILAK